MLILFQFNVDHIALWQIILNPNSWITVDIIQPIFIINILSTHMEEDGESISNQSNLYIWIKFHQL